MALDVLYIVIAQAERGVTLAAASASVSVDVSAYADDTAVILDSGADITATRRDLEEFGNISGIKINVHKSVCVPLGRDALKSIPPATIFPILVRDQRF